MAPDRLLPILLGAALGGGGIVQALHWRNSSAAGAGEATSQRVAELERELEILKRENESLRSLAQGGGELPVPEELVARVEKEFALAFRSNPVVHRVAREVLAEQIGASLDIRFGGEERLEHRQAAWRLIGWLGETDSLRGQLIALRAVGARAWFDDVSGEAWVPDDHDPQSIPDQAAVLRVLARILLHQHFPPPAGYPGDEPWRVREALHAGAAAGAEGRYFSANARAIGFMPMNKEGNQGAELLLSLPPFLQGLATFPSIDGKGFTDVRFLGGPDQLAAALRNPPGSTFEILFPDLTAAAGPPPEPPATPGEPVLDDNAGALGVRLTIDALDQPALARKLARAWRGDRWRLTADDAGEHLGWAVRLADPDSAADFAAAIRDLAAGQAGIDELPPGEAPLALPTGGTITVRRPEPTLVHFTHTTGHAGR